MTSIAQSTVIEHDHTMLNALRAANWATLASGPTRTRHHAGCIDTLWYYIHVLTLGPMNSY